MAAWRWARFAGLVAVGVLLAGCGSLGPPTSTLAQEPVLQPPVDAVELGRNTQEAQRGWLLGIDSPAIVQVVYAVELSSEQAARAWVQAYGERFDLTLPGAGSGGQTLGGTDDVAVQMQFGEEPVILFGDPQDYDPVPPGSSVVTVILSGRAD